MTDKSDLVRCNITFRNTDATEPLKAYATDKLCHCLQKFVRKNTEAHVVLKVEKNRQIAEISFHTEGHDFHVSEQSDSLYSSIDAVVSSLSQQLRKHKEKTTSHH